MSKQIIAVAIALASAFIGSCAGQPNRPELDRAIAPPADPPSAKYNPRFSQALNVALASRLTDPVNGPLFDLKRSELPADLRMQPAPTVAQSITRGLDLAMAADLFTGGARGMSGGSAGAMGAVFLLSAVAGGAPKHPASEFQEIVWMPKGMAATPEEAAALLKALTLQAVEKTFQEMGWTTGQVQADTGGLLKTRIETLKTYIGGDVCGKQVHCTIDTYADRPLVVARAPEIAKTGAAWVWQNRIYGQERSFDRGFSWGISERDLEKPTTALMNRKVRLDYDEISLRMTTYLPPWVYLYRPPGKLRPYPRMYHQGRELTFVEPL